ncbi:MAG: ABC transporter permease [Actinomycetia bacterium]|nr:ABC transporter permease [Actinomycetes bacterium]
MIALIARREIATRLQQRGFRLGMAAMLIIVAIACLIPKFVSGSGASSYDIAVVDNAPLAAAVADTGQTLRLTVRVHQVAADVAEAKVRAGSWNAAVIGDRIYAANADSAAVTVIQQAHSALTIDDNLRAAGLTSGQVTQAFAVAPLTVSAVHSAQNTQRQAIATITVILLFVQLIMFMSWVGMGVVEEKSTRIVELLLASVRPLQLLAGKLVGIGALAVGQTLATAVVALGVSRAANTLTIPGVAYATAGISFGWFVLGFAFFASLSAALCATVSRQEEVSGVLMPVSALVIVTYVGSLTVSADPNSTFARVFSMVPPFSVISMPARIAGGAPALDVAVSVALMIVATALVLLVAARIYQAAILHAGSKLKVRDAWRGERVSGLS